MLHSHDSRKEQLRAKIAENFNSMQVALDTVLDDDSFCHSMVVSGAAGVGKSYNIIKRLRKEHDSANIEFSYLNSTCSKLGLYEALYKSRHSHSVLLLDDVDVWKDEDQINILKAALETKPKGQERLVSFASTSSYLSDNDIPKQFDFQGKLIFITNKNLAKIANSKNSLAPHMSAFMTRTIFVDLEIHDVERIMIHIENVMRSTNILSEYGVAKEGSNQILEFMIKNQDKIREPSLRTAVLISGIFNKYPYDWEKNCQNLFLIKDSK